MSPEKQRIAIAGICGWEMTRWKDLKGRMCRRVKNPAGITCPVTDIPDYLNDLDAMHEAEKVLTVSQFGLYLRALAPNEEQWIRYPMSAYWLLCHASATRRAEAFLRTFGKWEPS